MEDRQQHLQKISIQDDSANSSCQRNKLSVQRYENGGGVVPIKTDFFVPSSQVSIFASRPDTSSGQSKTSPGASESRNHSKPAPTLSHIDRTPPSQVKTSNNANKFKKDESASAQGQLQVYFAERNKNHQKKNDHTMSSNNAAAAAAAQGAYTSVSSELQLKAASTEIVTSQTQRVSLSGENIHGGQVKATPHFSAAASDRGTQGSGRYLPSTHQESHRSRQLSHLRSQKYSTLNDATKKQPNNLSQELLIREASNQLPGSSGQNSNSKYVVMGLETLGKQRSFVVQPSTDKNAHLNNHYSAQVSHKNEKTETTSSVDNATSARKPYSERLYLNKNSAIQDSSAVSKSSKFIGRVATGQHDSMKTQAALMTGTDGNLSDMTYSYANVSHNSTQINKKVTPSHKNNNHQQQVQQDEASKTSLQTTSSQGATGGALQSSIAMSSFLTKQSQQHHSRYQKNLHQQLQIQFNQQLPQPQQTSNQPAGAAALQNKHNLVNVSGYSNNNNCTTKDINIQPPQFFNIQQESLVARTIGPQSNLKQQFATQTQSQLLTSSQTVSHILPPASNTIVPTTTSGLMEGSKKLTQIDSRVRGNSAGSATSSSQMQTWCPRLKEIFSQQENFVLKLHLEFKKLAKVQTLVQTYSQTIDQLVKRVGRIVSTEINPNPSVATPNHQKSKGLEEYLFLVKQHQRSFLAGLTLIWILQREDKRLFESINVQVSSLFDYLSQNAQLLQELTQEVEQKVVATTSDNNMIISMTKSSQKRESFDSKGSRQETRQKLMLKTNFAQMSTLIRKVSRQALQKTESTVYGQRKNSQVALSLGGSSAVKQLIELTIQIDEGKNVAKIKEKIMRLVADTEQSSPVPKVTTPRKRIISGHANKNPYAGWPSKGTVQLMRPETSKQATIASIESIYSKTNKRATSGSANKDSPTIQQNSGGASQSPQQQLQVKVVPPNTVQQKQRSLKWATNFDQQMMAPSASTDILTTAVMPLQNPTGEEDQLRRRQPDSDLQTPHQVQIIQTASAGQSSSPRSGELVPGVVVSSTEQPYGPNGGTSAPAPASQSEQRLQQLATISRQSSPTTMTEQIQTSARNPSESVTNGQMKSINAIKTAVALKTLHNSASKLRKLNHPHGVSPKEAKLISTSKQQHLHRGVDYPSEQSTASKFNQSLKQSLMQSHMTESKTSSLKQSQVSGLSHSSSHQQIKRSSHVISTDNSTKKSTHLEYYKKGQTTKNAHHGGPKHLSSKAESNGKHHQSKSILKQRPQDKNAAATGSDLPAKMAADGPKQSHKNSRNIGSAIHQKSIQGVGGPVDSPLIHKANEAKFANSVQRQRKVSQFLAEIKDGVPNSGVGGGLERHRQSEDLALNFITGQRQQQQNQLQARSYVQMPNSIAGGSGSMASLSIFDNEVQGAYHSMQQPSLQQQQQQQQVVTQSTLQQQQPVHHKTTGIAAGSKRRMSESPQLQRVNQLTQGKQGTAAVRKQSQINVILPPINFGIEDEGARRQYTLVLDLDETLVHFDQRRRNYRARPHAHNFIQEMSKHYELIIFTAGLKEYADWILDDFDKKRFIKYRLYRNSCKFRKGVYIKDLSRLGRDLSRTIIIDNIAENYELQPDNGINITSWFNSYQDTELQKLDPILRMIVESGAPDVRESLKQLIRQSKTGQILTNHLSSGSNGGNGGRQHRKQSAPHLTEAAKTTGLTSSTSYGAASRGSHQMSLGQSSSHLQFNAGPHKNHHQNHRVSHSNGAQNHLFEGHKHSPKQQLQNNAFYNTNGSIKGGSNGSQVLQSMQMGRMRNK